MNFDLSSQIVGNASDSAGNAATSLSSVSDMLSTQFQQGLQLARIQAQSGMISNLNQALTTVARNVRVS